ncbi:hypothetical protein V6N12_007674 [Hibiscus sabdariffa]|uniref:RNase H type-1 domain-containing protein n=1 Tax=Hibiscus sabdariffa TaxID=183260 RepID=A0ABR2F2G9_9ROSI
MKVNTNGARNINSGVYEGLATTWSLGYDRVVVKMDCRDAYDMVAHDMMARLAWQGSPNYHRYMEPPSAVWDALTLDKEFLHAVMT